MKAVLRIALTFFTIVPLQMGMNFLGFILLVLALVSLGNDGVLFLCIPAALLMTVIPVFSGGIALRHACTASLLHVRPHGRLKLFVGATLVITLVAALWALPLQIDAWSREAGSAHRPPVPPPSLVFQMAWAATAVFWIGTFAASRSQAAYAMLGVLPILLLMLGRHVLVHFDSFGWILPAALVLWTGFGIWLMRTRTVARPAVSPHGGTSETHPFSWLIDILPTSARATRANASSLHLLGGGTTMFVVNGLWIALIFVVLHFGMYRPGDRPTSNGTGTLSMLFFLAFMCAPVGYSVARRARLLWLRTGLDRTELFRVAEQKGLRAMATSWIIPVAAVAAAAATTGQNTVAMTLSAYVLPASLLAALLFYGGLAMTRGFGANALLVVALFFLFATVVVLAHPEPAFRPSRTLMATGLTLGSTVLLRRFALRSWQTLDWRIARLPLPQRRTT